jgi:hypothetical protein
MIRAGERGTTVKRLALRNRGKPARMTRVASFILGPELSFEFSRIIPLYPGKASITVHRWKFPALIAAR